MALISNRPNQADHPVPAPIANALIAVGHKFAARGWTPATSSNFSMRLGPDSVAVTRSGADKGQLTQTDIIAVDMDGHALDPAIRPSAETTLHTQLYRRFAGVAAVLHTHSRTQSVASRLFAADGAVHLEGWELQKAITGIDSHERSIELPVFANSQYMPDIMNAVDKWLDSGRPMHGYLIEGHGIYAWGRSVNEAQRHLEAFDFLLACELDLRRLGSTTHPHPEHSA